MEPRDAPIVKYWANTDIYNNSFANRLADTDVRPIDAFLVESLTNVAI